MDRGEIPYGGPLVLPLDPSEEHPLHCVEHSLGVLLELVQLRLVKLQLVPDCLPVCPDVVREKGELLLLDYPLRGLKRP